MLRFLSTVLYGVLLVVSANAAALPLERRAAVRVSSADLAALAPFTRFAGAAYCSLSSLQAWNCRTLWVLFLTWVLQALTCNHVLLRSGVQVYSWFPAQGHGWRRERDPAM